MNGRQRRALTLRGTDVDGAVSRLCGNEAIYTACLKAFLSDQTTVQLNRSVAMGSWDEAFTAAHALKGVAGNMGFVPLMHAVGQLVVLIRGGRIREMDEAIEQVNSAYRDITDGIHQFFARADGETKGEGQ